MFHNVCVIVHGCSAYILNNSERALTIGKKTSRRVTQPHISLFSSTLCVSRLEKRSPSLVVQPSPAHARSTDRFFRTFNHLVLELINLNIPFTDASKYHLVVSTMAEVITLSDDDDDIIDITPKPAPVVLRTSTSLNQVDNSLGATAHISTVSKINLEQFGIRTLANVLGRNQSSSQNAGFNPLQSYALPPVIAHTSFQNSIPRALKRPSPSPAVPNVSHQSTPSLRQRNSQNTTVPAVYNGHYMFEATEGYEPSRRSSRFSTKKLEGQFVCSFNAAKCYKLCDSVVGFINHLWSHIVYDPPFIPRKKKETQTQVRIPSNFHDTAALSKWSVLALKKIRTCEYCQAVFKTIYLMHQHRSKCHFDQDKTKTICNICEINFESTSILEAHKRKHISGEAPYKCKKCNYRTSVRAYFYEHFIERHINETLVCPICLYQEELRPTARRSKHIFVNSFVEHMQRHSTSAQYRCHMCSLTFNDRASLDYHRGQDHTLLDPLWQVHERPKIHEKVQVERMSNPKKISILQKKFLQTPEGHRISNEVACDEDEERQGYDLTCTGNTLFECECGFSSWNGNRAASHYHRCRKTIKCVFKDIERDKGLIRNDGDPKDELDIFAVYPQPTLQEEEAEALQEAALQKLHLKKDAPIKLRTDTIVYPEDEDFLLLKVFSTNKESDAIIARCIASIVTEDD
ncbi:hypothetical protein CRE_29615 [Caenorhabditis remanei]|uniref:C2H2-type domain-containing protein n=1 Tax=Caenorhabditis remanei TaxID=31234 RepID=E3LW20_CAERE|nr:hypothetical protein CRE_29615 [Caenorhabditis remanei]